MQFGRPLQEFFRVRVSNCGGAGQQLSRPLQPLDVIRIGMCGDQIAAVRQRKVHCPNQINDVFHCIFITNIDQCPVAV